MRISLSVYLILTSTVFLCSPRNTCSSHINKKEKKRKPCCGGQFPLTILSPPLLSNGVFSAVLGFGTFPPFSSVLPTFINPLSGNRRGSGDCDAGSNPNLEELVIELRRYERKAKFRERKERKHGSVSRPGEAFGILT